MCDFGTLVVLRAKIRTEAPGLRQLLSSEALALMAARLSKADDLESIAVEATHRLWLFGGMTGPAWEREQQHCLDILRHAHIDEELILSWAKQNLYQRTFSFHGNLLPNSYTAAVNMRLNHWLGADGVGIFVSTKAPELPLSESILLPFKLVQHRNEGAFTADGIALSHLNTGIQAGLNLARQNDYRSQEKTAVVFHTLQGDCSDLLFGESLGLAVFLALVKRKEASEFTVFDCMASGVLDQGALYQNDPEMYGKKYAAFTETGVKKILLPYFGEAAEDNSRDVFIQAQESVNDHVRRTLEDLKPIDLNKIKEEVDKLGTQIRFGSIEYEKAKNRLLYLQDRLKAAGCSTKTGSQALQMTISLHLGAVHNHLGETEEAGGRLKAAMDSRLDENEKLHACIRYAITLKDM
ncbi:MAG: hypothetical protein GX130_06670, partial [Candidatus Hydrogenedens sp.]|nr:hypothetical protein [Candidatus Hydrogenedens sp.]